MTYIAEAQIEARAAELWQRHGLEPGFDVERLLDDMGLGLVWESIDDDQEASVLGQLIPQKQLVVLNERHIDRLEDKEGRLRRYTVGHEIGHWILHADAIRSGTLSFFDGERVWCRDGSGDAVERQAEMFSAAVLIPKDRLLAAVPKNPWHGWGVVYRLADAFVVNVTPMRIRLERLGWMHRDDNDEPVSGPKPAPGQGLLFGG
jgi:Zn-dependent peptidase ImmA (M78 family)